MIESWSRRAFSGSSGTYHVRASELAAQRDRKLKALSATVIFLDDTEQCFHLEKRAKGAALLEQVYQHLELVEKDYFGLQYVENDSTNNSNKPKIMRWLDPSKSVKKQIGNSQTLLYFRVKFYVSDPSKLQEEYTRYQFYLQIKKDIHHGRLQLPASIACLLASYSVQSELGDYQPDEHGPNYLADMQLMRELIPGMNEDIEKKVSELHKLHKGQLPSDAEFNFLDHAKKLDMYGVELHKAKDSANKDIHLGVTSIGLLVFQNNIKINTFSWSKIMKISFKRRQFFIQLRREPSESYDTLLGFNMSSYRSSKTLWKACVEHHTFFRLHSPKLRRRFPLSLSSRFYYSGRTEYQTVTEGKQRGRLERVFLRSPSKVTRQTVPPPLEDKAKVLGGPTRPPRPYDNKVQSAGSKEPRKAWGDDTQGSDDDGGFLDRASPPFSPAFSRVLYADEDPPSPSPLYDTPPYSPSASPAAEDGLVTVKLQPDDQGRFGFNVKGGADLNLPILISKVAPNTPADRCTPRLSEGDQVVGINGRDVVCAYHEDVVRLIKEARDTRSGLLTLTIKPSVMYSGEGEESEEPPYQYVPAAGLPSTPPGGDALATSMFLLADGLASGALVAQYEQLYRKHPDMASTESKKPENVGKNRYRDISPYDETRVTLTTAPSGDYINANHISMCIAASGQVNRFIATQGPLPGTADDFWHMVREAGSALLVMLTTLVERGRTKCHKYWPDPGDSLHLGDFTVKCVSEETDESGSFVFRDFVLTEQDGTERLITHMQYTLWPDHGVPDSPGLFLRFTERVRGARAEGPAGAPVVVHCSAGIGRTGVLILMDTAMCLVQANEPVYPLDIVQTMRQQRAMMIQNACRWRHTCACKFPTLWPDHGVPDSPGLFLRFTKRVRGARAEGPAGAPVVVHCSAGIGRTGVLILMDTAMCLVQANEPVYPLDIVQTMRQQRAMMIQNASQYRFVCESVHAAYSEGLVKPLTEFTR